MKAIIGIITRNDKENFVNLLSTVDKLDSNEYEVMVINDGQIYSDVRINHVLFQHGQAKHTSACNNYILHYAVSQEIPHIFLVSDNISVINLDVFDFYIQTYEESKLPFLSFGLSAMMGADNQNHPNSRAIIQYKNTDITLNANTANAFTYINSIYVNKVGFFDERYKSVLELADYYYRGVEAGYCPPYGWFPDVVYSEQFLQLKKSNDNLPHLRSRIMHDMALFKHKWSVIPEQIVIQPLESVKATLKIIYDKAI
jgi:hypothetical protein